MQLIRAVQPVAPGEELGAARAQPQELDLCRGGGCATGQGGENPEHFLVPFLSPASA